MFTKPRFFTLYDASAVGAAPEAGGDTGGQGDSSTANSPATWEAYIASLPEEQRAVVNKLYEEHNATLLSAVKSTRRERDDIAGKLRDAAKLAEQHPDLQRQLQDQAAALEEANKRADFYGEANAQKCNNPEAAWIVAKANNLFTRKGDPDWEAIARSVPQLFTPTKVTTKGGAGAGTEVPPTGTSVNEFIRSAAGSRSIQS